MRGKEGPTSLDCIEAYNNTESSSVIQVIEDQMYKGIQVWKVPTENYYTCVLSLIFFYRKKKNNLSTLND